jgi:hypothetical protein
MTPILIAALIGLILGYPLSIILEHANHQEARNMALRSIGK